MRAAFVCTGNTFTPSMLYKENYFIKAAVELGMEVLVLASEYEYVQGRRETSDVKEADIEGYHLVRMSYKKVFSNEFLTEKVRNAPGLTKRLIQYQPDFIFYNCPQIYNIIETRRIKQALPQVKIVLDFSTKYINSAKNPLSLYILHKMIYRSWLMRALPYVDNIYYVSEETKEFIRDVYGLPQERMEENGLPGEVISREQYQKFREEIRREYGIRKDQLLFVHSGKMGRLKRTVELLSYFHKEEGQNLRLLIAGSLEPEIREEALKIIRQDDRVVYAGFVTGEQLTRMLCGADLYLQPGTISQTSQTAICCGCPVMFMRCPTNEAIFDGNGFLLENMDEIPEVFRMVCQKPEMLQDMKERSFHLAKERLDSISLLKKAMEGAGISQAGFDKERIRDA